MASKSFQIVIALFVAAAAVLPAVFFGLEHARLERRVARQREVTQHSRRLAEENQKLQELVLKTGGDAMTATAAVRADLEAARREVADLERRAREQRKAAVVQVARDTDALAGNRDPLSGLTRLEYFTDAGQGSPAAAFQTLGWAVVHKPERIASLFTLAPAARVKAEALIAGLPEGARDDWTPEKLGELFLTGALTSASAIQIAEVKLDGPSRAMLVFRIPGALGDPKLPMELGPNGWRVLVDERGIDVVRKQIGQAGERR